MKKSKNLIVVDERVAEAINLYYHDNFDFENQKNKVDYSIDFPILISTVHNSVDQLLEEGRIVEPIFNNIIANEKEYSSLYVKDKGESYYTNRLVTAISDAHNFDFKRKIDIFTPNIAEKLTQIFVSKYKDMLGKPTPYDIELVAKKHNIAPKKVKWVFKKLRHIGIEKCIYDLIDLNKNPNKAGTVITLKPVAPGGLKFLSIISKLLDVESSDVEIYYNYFKRVFNDLYFEVHTVNRNTTNLNNEQKEIYISYYKLLAMRVFEYFDVFKIISVDTNYINRLSMLLMQIHDEIKFLENNLGAY
ncbi:MAG: hypothetical protein K2K73_00495 [Ureaplasma sp.]|nr:hypothetical protein [Ureaplasma sp.]